MFVEQFVAGVFASLEDDILASTVLAMCIASCVDGPLLALVGVRCICRRIFPFSSIFRALGEASRRLPNLGKADGLGNEGVTECSFRTSTTVGLFDSRMGMREAVFIVLGFDEMLDMLPGLGLEKLAGEGLCGRDSIEAGDTESMRVKSVMVTTCCRDPGVGVIKLPADILLRRDAFLVGRSLLADMLLVTRRGCRIP